MKFLTATNMDDNELIAIAKSSIVTVRGADNFTIINFVIGKVESSVGVSEHFDIVMDRLKSVD